MKKSNIVIALLSMAFSAFVISQAIHFPESKNGVPGPGVFPIIISVCLLLCSVILIVKSFVKPDLRKLILFSKDNIRAYITMAVLILYIIVLPHLGFLLTNTIVSMGLLLWFTKKIYVKSMLVPVLISLAIYALFNFLLNVPLGFGLLNF